MSEQPNTVTVSLSAGQAAIFANLSKQEADAQQTLERVPIARNVAALAVVLSAYTSEQIEGQALHIDTVGQTITFALNGTLALVEDRAA